MSNYCLANPHAHHHSRRRRVRLRARRRSRSTNPCGNSAAILDPQKGQDLTNTPKHSGSLFTTYTLPFGLQVGYGLTYQGSFKLNNSALARRRLRRTTAVTPVFASKSYLTHRAFLSYPVTKGLTAQVNVQNFTDKRYFTGIRNNGWATPGEARVGRAERLLQLLIPFSGAVRAPARAAPYFPLILAQPGAGYIPAQESEMSHPRHDFSGHVRTDDEESGAVHGLFYAVPFSLLVWAVLLYWLFLAR